jgi:hypothetical protein
MTQPDVAFTAAKLLKFVQNPLRQHIKAINWAICYLHGTKNHAIKYFNKNKGTTVFTGTNNAAYTNNPDHKSSKGYIFSLFGGPINWKAGKQKTVITSMTEAELLALSCVAKEIRWWNWFFMAISFNIKH